MVTDKSEKENEKTFLITFDRCLLGFVVVVISIHSYKLQQ